MKHSVYKITNKITKEYYFGKHSTDNLDDSYMSSSGTLKGTKLRIGKFEEYGKENFVKETLSLHPTAAMALQEEQRLITKHINEELCYNVFINYNDYGHFVFVINNSGNIKGIPPDEYYNGNVPEGYIHISANNTPAKEKSTGKLLGRVSLDDVRWITGEITGATKGRQTFFNNITNKYEQASTDDERIASGILVNVMKGKVVLKKNNKTIVVPKGEVEEYKNNGYIAAGGNYERSDEWKNRQSSIVSGTIWINNGVINKHIKEEIFLSMTGWSRGRINVNTSNLERGRISVFNIKNKHKKLIQPTVENILLAVEEGYILGCNVKNHIKNYSTFYIAKGDDILFSNYDNAIEKIKLGFLPTKEKEIKNNITCKWKIHLEGKYKIVNNLQLDYYLSLGWAKTKPRYKFIKNVNTAEVLKITTQEYSTKYKNNVDYIICNQHGL